MKNSEILILQIENLKKKKEDIKDQIKRRKALLKTTLSQEQHIEESLKYLEDECSKFFLMPVKDERGVIISGR